MQNNKLLLKKENSPLQSSCSAFMCVSVSSLWRSWVSVQLLFQRAIIFTLARQQNAAALLPSQFRHSVRLTGPGRRANTGLQRFHLSAELLLKVCASIAPPSLPPAAVRAAAPFLSLPVAVRLTRGQRGKNEEGGTGAPLFWSLTVWLRRTACASQGEKSSRFLKGERDTSSFSFTRTGSRPHITPIFRSLLSTPISPGAAFRD